MKNFKSIFKYSLQKAKLHSLLAVWGFIVFFTLFTPSTVQAFEGDGTSCSTYTAEGENACNAVYSCYWHADTGFGDEDECRQYDEGKIQRPYELMIDGDTLGWHDNTNYYKFYMPTSETVTAHLNKAYSTRTVYLNLHGVLENGECNATTLETLASGSNDFTHAMTNLSGGKEYCLKTYDSSMSPDYKINLTGEGARLIGVNDSSEVEKEGPMSFIVAMTRANTENVTFTWRTEDITAIKGTNYVEVASGTGIMPAGEVSTTIDVQLHDNDEELDKTFKVILETTTTAEGGYAVGIADLDEGGVAKGTILSSKYVNTPGPDICYESRPTRGFCMFGFCMFYKEQTNVRVNNDISNVHLSKMISRGFEFVKVFSGIGIKDEKLNPAINNDAAEQIQGLGFDIVPNSYYLLSMFSKGVDYRLGVEDRLDPLDECIGTKYPMLQKFTPVDISDKAGCEVNGGKLARDTRTSYYDKALFKFGLFTQYTHIVTYTKKVTDDNGNVLGEETIQEVLQPCSADRYGDIDPIDNITGCGTFAKALNSESNIQIAPAAECHNDTPKGCDSNDTAARPIEINLPQFTDNKTSKVRSDLNMDHRWIIADQQIGKVNLSGDATTMVFEAPYSISYGKKVMLIAGISDTGVNAIHYVFKEGDYWIESWDLTADNIHITTVGNVRFFIKDTLTVGPDVTSFRMGNDDNDKFHMYLGDDVNIDASFIIPNTVTSVDLNNSYIHASDKIYINATTTTMLNGALSSRNDLFVSGEYSSFIYPTDQESTSIYAACPFFDGVYITGPFDAWDLFRNINDRNISTKIVSQQFKVRIASLNDDLNETELKNDIVIHYALLDTTDDEYITGWSSFVTEDSFPTKPSVPFTINKAHKTVAVILKTCADYNMTSNIYRFSTITACVSDCNSNIEETNGYPCYRYFKSSDDGFAIRPNTFGIDNITDGQIFTAKKPTSVTLFAGLDTDDSSTNSNDYNETEETSFLIDINLTVENSDCKYNSSNNSPVTFENGLFNDDIDFEHIGEYTLTIHEKELCEDKYAAIDCDDPFVAGQFSAGEPSWLSVCIVKVYVDFIVFVLSKSER